MNNQEILMFAPLLLSIASQVVRHFANKEKIDQNHTLKIAKLNECIASKLETVIKSGMRWINQDDDIRGDGRDTPDHYHDFASEVISAQKQIAQLTSARKLFDICFYISCSGFVLCPIMLALYFLVPAVTLRVGVLYTQFLMFILLALAFIITVTMYHHYTDNWNDK